MPKILDRLKFQLKEQGHDEEAAHAIAVAALQKSGNLKPGTEEATPKGERRGNMSPGQRAIDRAAKISKHPRHHFVYNPRTNRATLRAKYKKK